MFSGVCVRGEKRGAVKPQYEMLLATAGMCLQYVCMHIKPVHSLCVKV